MSNDVVTYEERIGALSVGDVRAQVNLIQHVMREVMQGPTKDDPGGVHYGIIPGTGKKPTLLKAGAEKLCLTFRLDPQYEIEQKQEGVHLTITSKCTLYHIPSGQRFGSGMGSCSTKESKYAYRTSARKCPSCGSEAIIKGKAEYGGGWICFKKKGGCGAKYDDGDKAIEAQTEGRAPNDDIADQYNTVLKMSNKRALVAAVLNTTAASDIFTQDIEDLPAAAVVETEAKPRKAKEQQPEKSPEEVIAEANTRFTPQSEFRTRTTILNELCAQSGMNLQTILNRAQVTSAEEMSEDDYAEVSAMLRRKVLKKQSEAMADRANP